MKFPSIRAFRRTLAGQSGFVVLLIGKSTELMFEGAMTPEQYEQMLALSLDIMKSKARKKEEAAQ